MTNVIRVHCVFSLSNNSCGVDKAYVYRELLPTISVLYNGILVLGWAITRVWWTYLCTNMVVSSYLPDMLVLTLNMRVDL